jgi:hypothetical protein
MTIETPAEAAHLRARDRGVPGTAKVLLPVGLRSDTYELTMFSPGVHVLSEFRQQAAISELRYFFSQFGNGAG